MGERFAQEICGNSQSRSVGYRKQALIIEKNFMNIRKYCVASILAGTAITMMGLPAGLLSTAQFVPKNDSTEVEAANPESVVDEVLWVVGDEPILKV